MRLHAYDEPGRVRAKSRVLTDRDPRGFEFAGNIHDPNAAVAVKDFDNRPSRFFVEHVSSKGNTKRKIPSLLIALSCCIVSFRLYNAMCADFLQGGSTGGSDEAHSVTDRASNG